MRCNGERVKSPQFFKQGKKEIAKLSRELARKKKGSNHRRKAKRRLAVAHARIANRRRDWFFKLAHRLCDDHDLIAIEDLNMDGMKRLWGRKVSDLAFAEFVGILEYVGLKRGVRVVKVDRFFASSRTCSCCGKKNETLGLADRKWVCGCGAVHDRDLNAAINIRDRALSQHNVQTLRVGDVRPRDQSHEIGHALAIAA